MSYEYLYAIGDPTLTITFDGASNNDCEFDFQVLEVGTNTDIQSVDSAFTVVDPTFSVADPEQPNYVSISSDGSLKVYETDTAKEGCYNLNVVITSNE